MPITPERLPLPDLHAVRIGILSAMGISGASPRSAAEAKRLAAAHLAEAVAHEVSAEGSDEGPEIDPAEVLGLVRALEPRLALAQRHSGGLAVALDMKGLIRMVGAPEVAWLAALASGLYPTSVDGVTLWGDDRAHAGDCAGLAAFNGQHWSSSDLRIRAIHTEKPEASAST